MSKNDSTTKICKKCGSNDFNPSGSCRECKKAYYIKNAGTINARTNERYLEQREAILLAQASYRASHPDKIKATKDKYRAANLENVGSTE